MDGLRAILERYRDSGLFTHAYAAHGRLGEDLPLQTATVSLDDRDVFDLASLTKALVTVPLIFRAAHEFNLDLNGTVRDWFAAGTVRTQAFAVDPEKLSPLLLGLTIKSLLRHESGLPAWWNFWITRLGVLADAEIRDRGPQIDHVTTVLNRAVQSLNSLKPQLYSDVGYILLGVILERMEGRPMPDIFQTFMQHEMGFDGIGERLHYATRLKFMQATAVPTAYCQLRRRQLVGEVHDENSAALGGETAHAGLFGSGAALIRYLRALYRIDQTYGVFRKNAEARVIPAGEPPNQPCLGWRQGADPSSAGFAGGKAMGHMGFTGVAFWVDPDAEEYAILLTNRVISGRINPAITAMRREVFSLMGQ